MLLLNIIYPVILGLLNRLRGSEFLKPYTSKGVISVLIGVISGLFTYYTDSVPVLQACISSVIVIAGVWIWASPGWGKYFSAYDGLDKSGEKEIGWIDYVGDKLVHGTTSSKNRIRGTLQMSLRGLYLYPMFMGLSYYNIWALLVGLAVLLQGPVYAAMRVVPNTWAVPIAEFTYFVIIGAAYAIL